MSEVPAQQAVNQQPQQQQGQSGNRLAPKVEDLYLESYAFTTAAAIVGSVDRKIFVLLRDGRNLFGVLRTFDQFANLVIQDTVERIYLDDENSDGTKDKVRRYGEVYRGVFMIRGENVVMMGELDIDTEDDHLQGLEQLPFEVVEKELKERHAKKVKEEKLRSKKLSSQGFVNDFVKSDMY
ncbi:Piso0_005285 [Millerozyma farinosa CBS 7064]|uniref:U6 snRNA-associated Sm-like protein LSm1 n=1 Tax=Pichia sorbitophila (strain ATCC MYA-4447 / BCRC 22081 / CBS 7064 / NBRC 10061 / NRRL Y-12695) TaxID=559304 RepID=G8Y4P7_PICSO|nr:Piso0_005285 [Millerozyma farinosa CBS 7064]